MFRSPPAGTGRLPVLLAGDGAGDPVILWGFPALRRIPPGGSAEVIVRQDPGDLSTAAAIALDLEGRPGGYSWHEMAALGARVGWEVMEELAPLLQWDGAAHALLPRFLELDAVLQDAVDNRTLDLLTAERIARVSRDPQTYARVLAAARGLSFSNRRHLFKLWCEIARRDGVAVSLGVVEDAPAAQRLAVLRRHRYPLLSKLHDRVARVQETALRGTGVHLAEPPNFEGRTYRITCEVGSREDLEARQRGLELLKGEIDELLGLLFQDPEGNPLGS